MTTKTKTPLDLSGAAAQQDLVTAQELRTQLLTELAEGQDVQDQLDTVDEEIATTKRQLARLTEARAAAALANTASAKHAAHEQTIAHLADGVLGAEKLAAMAQDVLATIAELRAKLTTLETQRAATYDTLQGAVVDSQHGAPNTRIATEMRAHLLNYVNALTLPTHFLLELHVAGIGSQKGIIVPPGLIEITVPAFDGKPNLASDVERGLEKIHAAAATIETWSANTTKEKAA